MPSKFGGIAFEQGQSRFGGVPVNGINPTNETPFKVSDLEKLERQYGSLPRADMPTYGSDIKASFLQDPESKLRYLADTLMPNDPERYDNIGYISGEVVFAPMDIRGNRSPQVVDANWLKDVTSFAVREALPTAGALFASPGGPGAVAGGAMAGEAINQAISAGLGDESGLGQRAGRVALTGVATYGGDIVGRGLAKHLDARRLARAASDPDASLQLDPVKLAQMERYKQEYGLTQLPHEASQNPYAIDRFKIASSGTPESGFKTQQFLNKQRPEEIYASRGIVEGKIGVPQEAAADMATNAVTAAKSKVSLLEDAREKAASKWYQQAAVENIEGARVNDVDRYFESQLAKLSPNSKAHKILSAQRQKLRGTDGNISNNIGLLHNTKLEWDALLKADPDVAADANIKRIMTEGQNKLVNHLRSNKNYNRGYDEFSSLSKPINEFENTLAGKLARMEKEPTPENVAKIVFDGTPQQIMKAKVELGEQEFNRIAGAKLEAAFNGIRETADKSALGPKIRDAIFRNPGERAKWRAVLGDDRFKIMNEWLDALDSFRFSAGKESITTRGAGQKADMADEALGRGLLGRGVRAADYVGLDWKRKVVDSAREKAWRDYSRQYIDAIFSDNPAQKLAELKRLQSIPRGTDRWYQKAAAIFGISVADSATDPKRGQNRRPQ